MKKQINKTPGLVVKDSKGNLHKVKTNFMGQKVREAYSVPRWFVAVFIYFGALGYVRDATNNTILIIVVAILLIVVIKIFVFSVIVGEEELKTMKPAPPPKT